MKTWVWIVIGGLTIGAILMLGSGKISKAITPQPKHIIPTKKIKLPRLTQVSEEQPPRNFGSCVCVGGKLTGPNCKLVGHSCTEVEKGMTIAKNCECGPDNIMTGVGCPIIGQDCDVFNGLFNTKPAHIHYFCRPGEMVMEGGGCVKQHDNPDQYSNPIAAV